MARIFTGDYSTGDFRQWILVQNTLYNGAPGGYTDAYPAQVISEDKDCGYCARFEVRTGDIPEFGGGERSQVANTGQAPAIANSTYWYAFSTKFDSTFPTDHHDLGWAVTSQWKEDSVNTSPTVKWGFETDAGSNGHWSLFHDPQSSPGGSYLGKSSILDLPIEVGVWHDIRMEIHWSTNDADGYVKVWHNGIPQTLAGGGLTFTGRTMVPSDSGNVHYSEGYYRQAGIVETGILYQTGFRMANTETSL